MRTRSSSAANATSADRDPSRRKQENNQVLPFKDNRPAAAVKEKMQEIAGNSPQAAQLKVIQSMAGNAVIQRYKKGSSSGHQQNDSAPMFTEQDSKPSLKNNWTWKSWLPSREHSLEYAKTAKKGATTDLLIADDNSLAINDTSKEPKEFYADPEIVKTSNARLENVHSTVRLKLNSNTITASGKQLQMVTPEQVRIPEEPFDDMLKHECIEMTGEVIGMEGQWGSEAVIGTGDKQTHVELSPKSTTEPQIGRLAKSLSTATDARSIKKAKRDMKNEQDNINQQDAKTYGTRSGKGELDSSEKKLGVNKYAAPEVGEAYTIYSNYAEPTGKKDYSRLQKNGAPTTRTSIWGYHYAGVSAKSKDGKDTITLENYNRRDDVKAKGNEVRDALLVKFRKQLGTQLSSQISTIEGTDLNNALSGQAGIRKTFVNEYIRILNGVGPEKAWFFAIYGSKKDQSFHEKQGGSGSFSNPITLQVRKVLRTAKYHWSEELTTLHAGIDDYVKNSDNALSGGIEDKNVLQALDTFKLAVDNARTQQELDDAKLILPAIDELIAAAEQLEISLTEQYIGTGKSLPETAMDFEPKFEITEELKKLATVKPMLLRLKNMVNK